MKRFLVERIEAKDGFFTITGSEARHITTVLRMRRGDTLILVDGKGSRFQAVIESATSREVQVSMRQQLPAPPPPSVEINLCQALLKSRPMDYVIQKTSELGIDSIYPFWTDRTVIRPTETGLINKVRRWREVAKASTKQSDRRMIPQVHPVSSFEEVLEYWENKRGFKVILWEEEGSQDLKGALRKTSPPKKFIGVVGPEGGFARQDILAARNAGFISVSLGYRVLRSETAAIILVALVQYEWGDLSLVPTTKLPSSSL